MLRECQLDAPGAEWLGVIFWEVGRLAAKCRFSVQHRLGGRNQSRRTVRPASGPPSIAARWNGSMKTSFGFALLALLLARLLMQRGETGEEMLARLRTAGAL